MDSRQRICSGKLQSSPAPGGGSRFNRLKAGDIQAARPIFGWLIMKWLLVIGLGGLFVWLMSLTYLLSTMRNLDISGHLPHGSKNQMSSTITSRKDRPLIIYAYHETEYAFANALFFIHHGLHDGADFIFILNGDAPLLSPLIPYAPHIQAIFRDNKCFDLGAYGEILIEEDENNNSLATKYSRFILLNSSIRGPFMPVWSKDCWTDAYLSKLTETTKLVGISYNCVPGNLEGHLQSMLLATDSIGLSNLLPVLSSSCPTSYDDAVHMEAECSVAMREAGYSVTALMTAFSSDPEYQDTCQHGDVLFDGRYYGTSIHPYETIFHKTNRDISPKQLELLTEWHDKMGYSSQKFCGLRA